MMKRPFIREATIADAKDLGLRLREEDIRELQCSTGVSPQVTLVMGVATADLAISICTAEGDVAAICGITRETDGDLVVGYPWLLASPLVEDMKVTFLRGSRSLDAFLTDGCDLLTNAADPRNTLHMKWLRFCGYRFTQEITRRPGYPALAEFVRINPCAHQ